MECLLIAIAILIILEGPTLIEAWAERIKKGSKHEK